MMTPATVPSCPRLPTVVTLQIPSQDSKQHDFLVDMADQLAPEVSLKKINELICSVKLLEQASCFWRQIYYFSLL